MPEELNRIYPTLPAGRQVMHEVERPERSEGRQARFTCDYRYINPGSGSKTSTQSRTGEKLGRGEHYIIMNEDKMPKTEQEWKMCLTQEQYEVLRKAGTEAPFTGKYYKHHETGMYVCGACGQELFSSDTKFDSGTGWPSFTEPVNLEHVELKEDTGQGPPSPRGFGGVNMTRTEVLCKKCGSHLGHVFPDGPKDKGGQRYCINSLSLDFKKR